MDLTAVEVAEVQLQCAVCLLALLELNVCEGLHAAIPGVGAPPHIDNAPRLAREERDDVFLGGHPGQVFDHHSLPWVTWNVRATDQGLRAGRALAALLLGGGPPRLCPPAEFAARLLQGAVGGQHETKW